LCSPLNPPEGDLKDIYFNNYVKMNEFCDIVLKSPSGGFRGLLKSEYKPPLLKGDVERSETGGFQVYG
jgi:hypothetical protein